MLQLKFSMNKLVKCMQMIGTRGFFQRFYVKMIFQLKPGNFGEVFKIPCGAAWLSEAHPLRASSFFAAVVISQ